MFSLSILLPLNSFLHSLYPFLSPRTQGKYHFLENRQLTRYFPAKEETSLNLQEFYSVPLMWMLYQLFLGELAMLCKNIKTWRKAASQLLQSTDFSFKARQINFSSLEFYLEEKQHSALICIWWLRFINGKAVSLCTEFRLGLASVLMLHPKRGEELSTYICFLKGVTLKCVIAC